MRKKIVKLIEAALPRLYDHDGELLSKRTIANKVLDNLPHPERLDIQPFQTWIPFVCSTCRYNQGREKGCVYDLFGEDTHIQHPPPKNCPLEYAQ